MKKYFLVTLLVLVAFTACKKDKSTDSFVSRVLVLNEGLFNSSTASISAYNPDTKEVAQNVFSTVNNNSELGDVAQSARIIGDELFIVVNNSHKIAVVHPKTLVLKRNLILAETSSPRYVEAGATNEIIVTDLYSSSVTRINATNGDVNGSFDMPNFSEGIVRVGNSLFVANPGAYLAEKNTVTVINLTNSERSEITVGVNPKELFVDLDNRVWVVCQGTYDGMNPGKVVVINGSNNEIISTIELGGNPSDLAFNHTDNKVYVLNSSGVQVVSMQDFSVAEQNLVDGYFYAMNFDERDEKLYVTDPKTYSEAGALLVYSKAGTRIDSVATGIIPSFIHFVD